MRKILVVIDMQNDFIDGSLGTPEAVAIVENVKAKIREYNPADICFTKDTHETNYLQTQEGRNLPVEHCIRGTKGWEIREDIRTLVKEREEAQQPGGAGFRLVFEKPTFGSVELAETLRELLQEEELEIEIVGLCTDICVVSNALLLKAYMPEVKITVDSSCCAGVTPASHEAALETMKMCQINVI